MDTETPRKRKPLVLIMGGLALALIGLGVWATREPAPPFAFLSKYEITERKASEDGKLKILVLKANVTDVWADIQREFSGKQRFSSSGVTNVNGLVTEYRSIGTEEGLIKVSNDLSFANQGFGVEIMPQNVRAGYCAIAFTRQRTIFDRAMEWIRRTFTGPTKPKQEGATTIHV